MIEKKGSTILIKKKRFRGLSISAIFGLFFLCIVSIAFLYPLFWMLDASFRPAIEIFNVPPVIFDKPIWVSMSSYSFDSFIKAFSISGEWNAGLSFIMSVIVTGCGIMLTLLLTSLTAYSFSFLKFKGRQALFVVILGSMMLPMVTMIAPYYKVLSSLKLTNNLLGVIIPYSVSAFGVFLLRQFYIKIPNSLLESAKIDGCGHIRTWWHIVLPTARPALAALAIVQFRLIWNDFLMPMIVLRSDNLFTMPIKIQIMDSKNYDKPYDAIIATGLITALVPMIFFMVFQRQFIEGLTGGVKE